VAAEIGLAEGALITGPEIGELDDAVAVRAAANATGASVAWGLGRITGTPERASTVALSALVGSQLGRTVAAGGTSRSALAAGFGLAALIQTPGVSRLVGCRPVGPVGWKIGLSSAAAPRRPHRPISGRSAGSTPGTRRGAPRPRSGSRDDRWP
jgi:hypothetical protein